MFFIRRKISNQKNNPIYELYSLGYTDILSEFLKPVYINQEIQKEALWCLCNISSSENIEIMNYFKNNFSIIEKFIEMMGKLNEKLVDSVRNIFLY